MTTRPSTVAAPGKLAHLLRAKLQQAVATLLDARDLANRMANAQRTTEAYLHYDNVTQVWRLADIAKLDTELFFMTPLEAERYRSLTSRNRTPRAKSPGRRSNRR